MKSGKLPLAILLILVVLTASSICKDDLLKSAKCLLKPEPGPCKAALDRYYYDNTEGKCKSFVWGGCDGVVPFETLKECESACGGNTIKDITGRCQLKPNPGPCEAYIERYFYNVEEEKCQMFVWGGCEGVVPFVNLIDCIEACGGDTDPEDRCSLLPDPGPCKARVPKYYFDKENQKCAEFIWGGCDGVVPFQTLVACQSACAVKGSSDRCSLSPDPGPCEAAFERYYYNQREGKCKSFTWGGCDGVVPFETLSECKTACAPNQVKDRCTLDPDPGPCKATFTKYYYDKESNACKTFIWGGCRGTVPFDTMEECQVSCGKTVVSDDPCLMKPDPGPCRGAFKRYYYDGKEKRCKQFTWGGCKGRVPFVTVEACMAKCG